MSGRPLPIGPCGKACYPSLRDAREALQRLRRLPKIVDPDLLAPYECKKCRTEKTPVVFHLGNREPA